MNINGVTRIAIETLPGAQAWVQKLLQPLNSFIEQMTAGLRNNLTHAENMRCKELELSFTHGTERVVASPGFSARGAIGMWANGQAVSAVKLAYRQDGQLGLTVYFQSGSGTATTRVRLEA